RYPNDDDASALAGLAARGIHSPDSMPFAIPWSTQPSPKLEREALQHYWKSRGEFTAARWALPFATVVNGEVVGTQAVHAADFVITRAVDSGSWLGQAHQGKGIGKEMRAAMLHLAFAGLGAQVAYSGAWHDNPASLGVSKALGYRTNGDQIRARLDRPTRMINLKLPRTTWEKTRRDDIVIEGLEPCLDLFGLAGDPAAV
ncbi:MAG: GNAT family N-acetyltransferase, partial [Actinobacteria bacterium]|nr:GNAT family N-acetyltransferase [Actinomycetota bacterium]